MTSHIPGSPFNRAKEVERLRSRTFETPAARATRQPVATPVRSEPTAGGRAEQTKLANILLFSLVLDGERPEEGDWYLSHLTQEWTRLLGYSAAELQSLPLIQFIHMDDRAKASAALLKLFRREDEPVWTKEAAPESVQVECQFRTHIGTYKPLKLSIARLEGAGSVGHQLSKLRLFYGVAEEYDSKARNAATLRPSESELQSALDGMSAHIAILDQAGTITAVNAAWCSFAAVNELTHNRYGVGVNYLDLCDQTSGVEAPEAAIVARGIREVLSMQRLVFTLDYAAHSAREERWFRIRVTRFAGPQRTGAIVCHENITENKRATTAISQTHLELERQVEKRTAELSKANTFLREQINERARAEHKVSYLSYHDALTHLPNRILVTDRLSQAVSVVKHNKQLLAVMVLTIDRLKAITDTLGLSAGDRVLQAVAERLTICAKPGDTVGYMGGSEFAVLLTQIENTQIAVEFAQSLLNAFEKPFDLDGRELYLTISLGISLSPDDGADAATLLKNASAALERAKEQTGSNYQFYTSNMNAKALAMLSLENNLRQAIAREEFIVYYQPQLKLSTGHVVGAEALVRWKSPELGMVSPGEFIPVAEASGLIVPIGEFVLRTACAQAKAWLDDGLAKLRIAVNLSAHQFQKSNLAETVGRILHETGLDPKQLELELTESAVMKNAEYAIATLRALKAMGLKISIDDFGTGYSSLSYLKRFPLDVLKIDQSFMRDATNDPNDAAIVRAVITLAHNLNLEVIAEGVETQDQLTLLRHFHCDEMQGYLFSRPLPADAFKTLLEDGLLSGWTQPLG